MKVFYTEYCSH